MRIHRKDAACLMLKNQQHIKYTDDTSEQFKLSTWARMGESLIFLH